MDEENNINVLHNVYGDVCLRKARRKRQKLLIQELLLDYANNTTLHGLPYVTRKGLTIIEKIFWFLTFIISVCLCGYNISSVWIKWKNSPVIVTVSERLVPVSQVPFPSVTICPQTKCVSSAYNYTEAYNKFEYRNYEYMSGKLNSSVKKDMEMYEDISLICDKEQNLGVGLKDFNPRNHADASVIKNMLMVTPNISSVFQPYFMIRGKYQHVVDSKIHKVLTSEGVCYNINSRPVDQIFRRQSLPYLKNAVYDKPYKAKAVSNFPDMVFFLIENNDEKDPLCNSLNSGFRVYVHHPDDLPQASLHYYAVLNGQSSLMALSFSMLSTSEALERYDPQIRQCYLPHERYLQHFQIYTSNNCRIECLANITLKECGCVGFYMPRVNKTPICTLQSYDCMFKAAENLVEQESSSKAICQCLPPCESIEYEAEILKTDYSMQKFEEIVTKIINKELNFSIDEPDTSTKHSKLEVYFKKPRFVSMRRSEMFGVIDFLANCGGLLGLFLGFSFLSLVEIFYFLTLRLCCTLKKDLKKEKAQIKKDKESVINKLQ